MAVLAHGSGAAAAPRKKPPRPEDRAAQAAIAATHGGKAVKVARESERGATWEVEVLMPDGRRLDVLLDTRLRPIDTSDEREPGETPAPAGARVDSRQAATARETRLAARAAARAVGGGILLDVDRASERRATWEVEFMKLDGKRVSVLLDDRYRVVRVDRGKSAN